MAAKAEIADRDFWGFDPDMILVAQRRYLEAWAGAGQIMADAMRTVVQRQVEFTQSGMREFWSEHQAMLHDRPGEHPPTEQFERLCTFCERAFANYQELGEIMLKAQSEAVQVLSDCASASLEDVRKAA
jgi:hypothetical protein